MEIEISRRTDKTAIEFVLQSLIGNAEYRFTFAEALFRMPGTTPDSFALRDLFALSARPALVHANFRR